LLDRSDRIGNHGTPCRNLNHGQLCFSALFDRCLDFVKDLVRYSATDKYRSTESGRYSNTVRFSNVRYLRAASRTRCGVTRSISARYVISVSNRRALHWKLLHSRFLDRLELAVIIPGNRDLRSRKSFGGHSRSLNAANFGKHRRCGFQRRRCLEMHLEETEVRKRLNRGRPRCEEFF
jgi:hypothetical protein